MEKNGEIAPPTKVQNFFIFERLRKKGEVDSIDNSDLIWLNDNSFDKRSQDLSACVQVRFVKMIPDRIGETVEALQCFA